MEKAKMTEEKAKRIAVGATIGGVLLLMFLVAILIVQFVQIGVTQREKNRLQQEIESYEALLENKTSELEFYETEVGMYHLALEQGWGTPSR